MTPQAFDDLLDRHGGDAARWPPESRDQAERLLRVSHEARCALAAMREAEQLLGLLRAAPQGDASTVAARAMRHPQRQPARLAALRVGWAAAAAAALAIGILVGGTTGADHDDDAPLAFATVLGSSEAAYVD